jgi:hypothetical protein
VLNQAMLNQFFSEGTSESNEINTSIIKIRGKTLIFVNSIYQLSNISSLRLLNLSTTQAFPKYIIWLIVLGVPLIIFTPTNMKIFGIVMVAYAAWQFYRYQKNKFRIRYGLKISLNSGETPIIVYSDRDFLQKIMLVLYNIMNSNEVGAFTFNLDQRQISEDKSINIGNMHGSTLVAGNVNGDIVSNV